jgi:hypothetical protein
MMGSDIKTMLKKINNAEKKRGAEIDSVAEEKREFKYWTKRCGEYNN